MCDREQHQHNGKKMTYQITTKTNRNQTVIIINFPNHHFTEIVDANGEGLDTDRIAARVSKKVAREVQAQVISIFNKLNKRR